MTDQTPAAPLQTLTENYLAAEAPLVALVESIPGLKAVEAVDDFENALKRLAANSPAAFIYYDRDDPVSREVEAVGAAEAVQNWFVVVVDRVSGNAAKGETHRARMGPILSALRTTLPGSRVARASLPIRLHQGPVRRLLAGNGVAYVFHLKLAAPIPCSR